MMIYLKGGRELNIVEHNIIGVKHGESLKVPDCGGMVILDTDNFNRISGIEILFRNDILPKLDKLRNKTT